MARPRPEEAPEFLSVGGEWEEGDRTCDEGCAVLQTAWHFRMIDCSYGCVRNVWENAERCLHGLTEQSLT